MRFSLFTFFSVSRHMPGPKVCVSHYSRFSVFLAIFQVLQCAIFIFQFFHFSCHIPGHSVFCLIFHVFLFSRWNPGTTVWISQYFTYSTVSCHISGTTVWDSLIAHFSVIFAIIHVLACDFLIFLICQFFCHFPGPTMWVSHFLCWGVLSAYSRFYSGHFHFSIFSVFLEIFQVI